MTTRPKVLVLGCGPAGLIAAHAARQEFDAQVIIMSVKRPSHLFGCQYLHAPIKGATPQEQHPRMVRYELRGDVDGYRRKVYGTLTPPVSPQQYAGDHLAWDLRATYRNLWRMYEPRVIGMRLSSSDIVPLLSQVMPDYVISSIPLPVLCQVGDQHTFLSMRCWALGDAPELDQRVPVHTEPFTVVCNGLPDVGWYRISNVYGHATMEWPGYKNRPPVEGVVSFDKPLSSDCDCMPSVLRVGRYGRWQKGILAHEAYDAVVRRMSS